MADHDGPARAGWLRPATALRLRRDRRIVGAVMAGVLASVAAAAAFSQYRSSVIDGEALRVTRGGLESVAALVATRSELLNLERILVRELAAYEAGGQANARLIRQSFDRAAGLVRSYHEVQGSAAERHLHAELRRHMSRVGSGVERLARLAAAEPNREGPAEVVRALDRSAAAATATGEALIFTGLNELERQLERIAGTRRLASYLGMGLFALALALALLAAFMAMRTSRGYARAEGRARSLEAQVTELERFAGLIAHDVLGPLGAVGVALQLTKELHPDERTDVLTSRAQRSLSRVKLIVDSLLAFARAGAQPSPAARSDASRVAAELLDEAAQEASERGVGLVLEAPGPVELACDEGALASILSNLIANALKHGGTAAGEPRQVMVRILPEPDRARISVEDTGPGLTPEVAARIFEPYVRGPEARETGSGLGLAIVKRLVEAHGGAVGVDSHPGQGSAFWFELPRAAPATA